MTLPRAQLTRPSMRRRLSRWVELRLEAPQTLREAEDFVAASYWSLTGGLAAGMSVSFYALCKSGVIWEASVPFTIGSVIVAIFGVLFWFWPFLASYYMYLPLHFLGVARGRVAAMVYGALWHCGAHYWLLSHFDAPLPWSTFLCPLLVGGLWGSWLPAALAPEETPR